MAIPELIRAGVIIRAPGDGVPLLEGDAHIALCLRIPGEEQHRAFILKGVQPQHQLLAAVAVEIGNAHLLMEVFAGIVQREGLLVGAAVVPAEVHAQQPALDVHMIQRAAVCLRTRCSAYDLGFIAQLPRRAVQRAGEAGNHIVIYRRGRLAHFRRRFRRFGRRGLRLLGGFRTRLRRLDHHGRLRLSADQRQIAEAPQNVERENHRAQDEYCQKQQQDMSQFSAHFFSPTPYSTTKPMEPE